jgi:hypothetical protein
MATARKTAAEKAEKATYVVVSPLDHDQVRYALGEEVELTEAEAEPLLGHTVVKKKQ